MFWPELSENLRAAAGVVADETHPSVALNFPHEFIRKVLKGRERLL